ncbi:MAG: hypothetical protein NTU44_01035 [Bacteroidetes bacterium]|nr:hypothetical protein [Bacteroidota bacterium]
MKQILSFSMLLLVVMMQQSYGQVSINTDGSNAPPSAMLEVKSTDKGFLPPRLSSAQMFAIQNPDMGLMIFNTDIKLPCWYDGTKWIKSTGEEVPWCGNVNVLYEGQVYHTVLIGTQCWLKENLNVGTMISGASNATSNNVIEKYCYDDDQANCAVYGGFYSWDEMMQYTNSEGTQGICPSGWHIPADAEWTSLISFLGGFTVAGGKMKEPGYDHWSSPNTDASNESGFTALGGGYGAQNGSFYYQNTIVYFWSSTRFGLGNAYNYNLTYDSANANRGGNWYTWRFSVRCLKDN